MAVFGGPAWRASRAFLGPSGHGPFVQAAELIFRIEFCLAIPVIHPLRPLTRELRDMTAELDFSDGAAVPNLEVAWIHGSEAAKYNTDPDIQVHAYDEHTYILRQNMAVSYEAPFMFLLFGRAQALLLDTGATANHLFFPLRRTVDSIIAAWLSGHPHPDDYALLVLHTHSHTDHVAADGQFADRPNTVVIGAKRDAAWPYFGFDGRPESVATVDLGGRRLDCLATPGHHEAAVTYYDRYSGILFTGDTVYPGRLYIFDWPEFIRSIDRLVYWCAQRPVTYLLGCHIEMTTTPGVDYPVGWSHQPDEARLELTGDHLTQIRDTLKAHKLKRARYVLPQLIITPVG
jgi:glyoxylase-like metal-dependent hydrolase (beta-lactamase superfamily II)